jgi:hypothetical protein
MRRRRCKDAQACARAGLRGTSFIGASARDGRFPGKASIRRRGQAAFRAIAA